VTLPNIDIVISMDIDRRVGVAPGGKDVKPFFVRLPDVILHQRRGRTGRMNNGRFIKVQIRGPLGDQVIENYEIKPWQIISQALSFGYNAKQIVTYMPELIIDALGIEPGTNDYNTKFDRKIIDPVLDKFGTNLEMMVNNLSPTLAFKSFQEQLSSVDGSQVPQFEISALGRFSQNQTPVVDIITDAMKAIIQICKYDFPDIVGATYPGIEEKMWEYKNVLTPLITFNNFTDNCPDQFNGRADAQKVMKSAHKAIYEAVWENQADVWKYPNRIVDFAPFSDSESDEG
jgi:hypothetical protein